MLQSLFHTGNLYVIIYVLLFRHSAVLLKDQLVIFGGWDYPVVFNDLHVLDLGKLQIFFCKYFFKLSRISIGSASHHYEFHFTFRHSRMESA